MLNLFFTLLLLGATFIPSSKAACSIARLGTTWSQGQDGTLYFKVPQSTSSWTLVMNFNKAVRELNAWDGISLGCSGNVCKYKNEDYNADQRGGDFLELGYQILFSTTNSAPELMSITFNGVSICSPSNPQTTTTTTTRRVTTTTKRPAITTTTKRPTTTKPPPASGRCADYSQLIDKSLLFYEAQRSGRLPANKRVPWRGDSTWNDRGENGEDLSGGYFDAGDYIKFGFPMASAMTVMAWGGIIFPEGYAKAGMTNYLLEAVKWGTDYFIKAHVSPNELYGQVGDGDWEHNNFWGRPEDINWDRPAWKITTSEPGSELAGETAAAMAAASILFRTSNPSYSSTLLTHAKQLFNFAKNYPGTYSESIPQAYFYKSYNGYNDELIWAALWLYKATNENTYLADAKAWYSSNGVSGNNEVLSWDSKYAGVKVLMATLTGEAQYARDVEDLCRELASTKTQGGLAWYDGLAWGSLRYAANAAFVCLAATDIRGIPQASKDSYVAFAKGQMEYILGSNKAGQSFVVGFGSKYPQRPHHASSSCPPSGSCGWSYLETSSPNPRVLQGALVGGPYTNQDKYEDVRGPVKVNGEDLYPNEVATDYNAGFQSALAGLRKLVCP